MGGGTVVPYLLCPLIQSLQDWCPFRIPTLGSSKTCNPGLKDSILSGLGRKGRYGAGCAGIAGRWPLVAATKPKVKATGSPSGMA